MELENKWVRAAIPALLIHMSIGTVYCWSVFKATIATQINSSPAKVEWGFSIAIFFLGMSAAFGGRFVEKNIKKASFASMIFFVAGLLGTGLSIHFKSLLGIYLSYGVIMGIGLGIGYLTPVKNLMLWFSKHKGLGTGLAVAGFGLAKVVATPLMEKLLLSVGLVKMFYILACFYAVLMFIAYLLIQRPADYKPSPESSQIKKATILKQPLFISIWFIFYLNITCGLALISQEKDILHVVLEQKGYSETTIIGWIAVVLSLDALFNAFGRLGYSSLSDKLKNRDTSYRILLAAEVLVTLLVVVTGAIDNGFIPIILLMLFVVNASYGGGFSTLPVLLEQYFGMSNISMIHGLALSAWAFAGLSGNQLSSLIVNKLQLSYGIVIVVIFVLYLLAFVLMILSRKLKPVKL